MKVSQLREMLQALEAEGKGELEVRFSYNYGDYWSTNVAAGVDSVEEGTVEYSEYHQMDKVVEYDAEDEGQLPAGAASVILLS